MRKNLVLEKLKKRKPSLGTWIEIGHPDVTEVLGNLGLDWFVIDMEHSIHSVERAQVLMQAMATSPTLPFVRVPWNDMVMIKRVLDIGAYGVVIPMVNTKEEAVNAVKACRYPQKGGLRPYPESEFIKTAT
jgi:2-keto-3-deoxy-L-rhamnonate aldolase RhmA